MEELEDLLDDLRLLLDDSKLEQMRHFKKGEMGKDCSYYIKSKMLWDKLEKDKVIALLKRVGEQLE